MKKTKKHSTSDMYKKTSLAIRKDLHKRAKHSALLLDIPLQEWMDQAIEEKLQQEGEST
ncbi:MAG: hypothetical protein K9L24_00790 [Spirochaetia bacterium]|nr:hypothetical protein [Spirochaetia bacterium]MCF7945377.1 hypothetical protein [Spirochaetia bacterium]